MQIVWVHKVFDFIDINNSTLNTFFKSLKLILSLTMARLPLFYKIRNDPEEIYYYSAKKKVVKNRKFVSDQNSTEFTQINYKEVAFLHDKKNPQLNLEFYG